MKALGENLTFIELLKVWLRGSDYCRKAICVFRVQKYLKSYWGQNLPMAWAQGHSPTYHENIIHHSGPLPRPRGVKDEHRQLDSFTEQLSEHHFSILQRCIPVSKEKADTVSVRNSRYSLVIVCSYALQRVKLDSTTWFLLLFSPSLMTSTCSDSPPEF